MGKVLSKLHQVKPNGRIDLIRGIKVANVSLLRMVRLSVYNLLRVLHLFYLVGT